MRSWAVLVALAASLSIALAACTSVPASPATSSNAATGTVAPTRMTTSPIASTTAATGPMTAAPSTLASTPTSTASAASGGSVAAGAQIFQRGIGPDGRPIPRTGGAVGPMMGGMMAAAGCAACHGPDGHGLQTPMFTSPNITYANLTDPKGFLEPDGSHGPTYTDAQIRRAITQGVDAKGQPLERTMPRWQLTDQDMSDLVAYLKTLR